MSLSDDYSNTTATTGVIEVGSQVTGNIELVQDEDWFKVSLVAGTTYLFDLRGADGAGGTLGGGSSEAYLRLYGPSGSYTSKSATGGGVGGDPLMSYTPTVSGQYFLSVSDLMDKGTGTYTVSVLLPQNQASHAINCTATHWKSGKALQGVGLGLFDGATELKTGSNGTLSAQGFQDPDGVDDGQTVLNPTLAADPKQASITLTDVLGALKVYLNKPLDAAYDSPYKYIAADFQGDGDVDLSDVLSLLKYYLKKPVDAAPSWVFVDSAQTVTVGSQNLPASNTAGQALSKSHAVPADIDVDLNSDTPLQLIGVLRGDLDGSAIA